MVASLLRDPHHTRYVILVLIQGRGLGGGLAARTAASTAQFLAAQETIERHEIAALIWRASGSANEGTVRLAAKAASDRTLAMH